MAIFASSESAVGGPRPSAQPSRPTHQELRREYAASYPREQFEYQAKRWQVRLLKQQDGVTKGRKITFPIGRCCPTAEGQNLVRRIWHAQGIWQPDWGPAWPDRTVIATTPWPNHVEIPPSYIDRGRKGPKNVGERWAIDERESAPAADTLQYEDTWFDFRATRPLPQFIAQLRQEREWLKDELDYTREIPALDVDTLAYQTLRQSWVDQGIWRETWQAVPHDDDQWLHERMDFETYERQRDNPDHGEQPYSATNPYTGFDGFGERIDRYGYTLDVRGQRVFRGRHTRAELEEMSRIENEHKRIELERKGLKRRELPPIPPAPPPRPGLTLFGNIVGPVEPEGKPEIDSPIPSAPPPRYRTGLFGNIIPLELEGMSEIDSPIPPTSPLRPGLTVFGNIVGPVEPEGKPEIDSPIPSAPPPRYRTGLFGNIIRPLELEGKPEIDSPIRFTIPPTSPPWRRTDRFGNIIRPVELEGMSEIDSPMQDPSPAEQDIKPPAAGSTTPPTPPRRRRGRTREGLDDDIAASAQLRRNPRRATAQPSRKEATGSDHARNQRPTKGRKRQGAAMEPRSNGIVKNSPTRPGAQRRRPRK